jgi:hypothetical protein
LRDCAGGVAFTGGSYTAAPWPRARTAGTVLLLHILRAAKTAAELSSVARKPLSNQLVTCGHGGVSGRYWVVCFWHPVYMLYAISMHFFRQKWLKNPMDIVYTLFRSGQNLNLKTKHPGK